MRSKWTVVTRGVKNVFILDPDPRSESTFYPLSEVCGWFGLAGEVACIAEELLVAGFSKQLVITWTIMRALQEGEKDRPLPQDFIIEAKRTVANVNRTKWAREGGRHFVLVVEPQGRLPKELAGEIRSG